MIKPFPHMSFQIGCVVPSEALIGVSYWCWHYASLFQHHLPCEANFHITMPVKITSIRRAIMLNPFRKGGYIRAGRPMYSVATVRLSLIFILQPPPIVRLYYRFC